ncbi:3-deoxy-manno-octulosonate cytidylyltransferase [Marinibaculum pumilum]|uniref:3-deoxy-manno-octulosonate cytidylyltransferase n=1 Tax=Marinibaculum pumilum TaxID=1766165 RepID=A0ABV7L770_9PROT
MSQPTLIVIPARLAATRLPDKPLAMIGDAPMIVQVWRRATEAALGRVVVAAGDAAIAEAVAKAGGEAVMTDPDLPSGTDRIHAAMRQVDPEGRHGTVINLQGDLPAIPPASIAAVLEPLRVLDTDIATLAVPTMDDRERADPNVVKAIPALPRGLDGGAGRLGRALYFTRSTAPWGEGPVWHHVGIYAYRRDALERFVRLPPSPLERREKLEQLRALENGLSIGIACIDAVPAGVDTPDDLARMRALFSAQP